MRTHKDVIRDAGGVPVVARKLGLQKRPTTVQSWWQRDSIPGEYWLLIAQLELASLPELALAAATRRQRPHNSAAA
jgi:hypothetical protein